MKQFIHELFIKENEIDVKNLSEGIRKKIETWEATKKTVYNQDHKVKRNINIGELEELSDSIMEDIKNEIPEDEPAAQPSNEPVVPKSEPSNPATDPPMDQPFSGEPSTEPIVKKKKKNLFGWILGSLILGGTIAAIIHDKKSSKK